MRRAKTQTKKGKTPEQRSGELQELRVKLEAWQGEVPPAQMTAYIARFDGYSERNALLIAMQSPEATDLDGFHAWLQRGRCVRKGEKGIRIMAPAGVYRTGEGEDAEDHLRFRLATVFDVSQTDEVQS
jgi:hypothetical protein